jgi:hypothetical protein
MTTGRGAGRRVPQRCRCAYELRVHLRPEHTKRVGGPVRDHAVVSQTAPNALRNGTYVPSLDHLEGEPGDLVGRDVLGGAGGLSGDELEIVPGRDVDHTCADALNAAVVLVALLGGAEEQAPFLCTQMWR